MVADGRVFTADADTHVVKAFRADSGEPLWTYTAGGPVDSPPTIWRGLAIFGSADGRVYAVRASDGEWAWRFDAAPADRRLIDDDRLESVWPVPGSVLIQDGKCWFAAGRSSYLDGGIRVYCLDPATGDVLGHRTIYSPDPKTGEMPEIGNAFRVPGLLNDIPGSNGSHAFIRQINVSSEEEEEKAAPHVWFTGGFLDDTMFNRTCWIYDGFQSAGLMVLGEKRVYTVSFYSNLSRDALFAPGQDAYRLACFDAGPAKAGGRRARPIGASRSRNPGKPLWRRVIPIRPTAMVRAAGVLFLAGPPDVVDRSDPHAAWEGRKGGLLLAVSAEDGEVLHEARLSSPPAWNGMAAAAGKLFVTLKDGQLLCFTGDL